MEEEEKKDSIKNTDPNTDIKKEDEITPEKIKELKETVSGLVQTETLLPISIYPNPTNNHQLLTILASETCEVEIRDLEGRLVTSFRLEPNRLMQLSLNHAGLYLVYCKQQEKVSVSRLLVN